MCTVFVDISAEQVSSLFSSLTLTKHSGSIWVRRSKLESSSSPPWAPPLLTEEAVVVVVVPVVLVEVMVVAAPVSDDIGVPLQDSMFLHHCIVSDPTLQK
jgi:hypothetical protein